MAIKKKKSAPKKTKAAERPVSDDTTPPELADTVLWDDEMLTTRELMAMLKLSRTKVWELVQKEGLPAFKIGGDYRYRRSEVLVWLERYRTDKGAS